MTLLPNRDIDLTDLGGLIFNEKYHSYHNSDGEKYTGVTTLISKYKSQKFNADNTSKYKAMKDYLPKKIFDSSKTENPNLVSPGDIVVFKQISFENYKNYNEQFF